MDYKTLDELNELIEKELKKLVQKSDLTPAEVESATKAVCLMEKIIRLREGSYEDEYSGRYYGEDSYARGRNQRTGRYVSRDGRYYDSYSMRDGYSGHSIKDRAIDKLERMMDEANSEYERESIRRMISQIRADEMK